MWTVFAAWYRLSPNSFRDKNYCLATKCREATIINQRKNNQNANAM